MPIILFAVAIDLIGFGIILPLLPFYALAFGASAFEVTMIAALFSLAQFIASPIMGRLSDRWGRKPLFLSGIILYICGFLLLAFANSLMMIFLARFLAGIGAGKVGIAQAMLADITKPEKRAQAMGFFGASFGIGMIVGPVIGLSLVGSDPANPDFRSPALAAACLSGLSLILSLFLVRETHTPSAQARVEPRIGLAARYRLMQGVPHLIGFIVLMFLVSFVFTQMEAIFGVWMNAAFGWGAQEALYVFIAIGVLLVIVQGGLVGPLRARFGEWRVLNAGGLILAVGLMLPALEIPALFGLSVAMICIGYGLLTPNLSSLVSQAAPENARGLVMGEYQSAGALGRIFGPLAGGLMFDHLGHNWPMTTGGLILAATLLAFAHQRRALPTAR